MEAVEHDGLALQHASAELRHDRDVVMAAVKQNGWALRYASARTSTKNQKFAYLHRPTERLNARVVSRSMHMP